MSDAQQVKPGFPPMDKTNERKLAARAKALGESANPTAYDERIRLLDLLRSENRR